MCLFRRPFRWPCGGVEAVHAASPDAACPRLHIGSHWTLPLGNYLLRIAPAAAMATINAKCTLLLAILMAIAVRRYYTARIARWRKYMAFIKATKRHHRASTCSDIIKGTRQLRLFRTFHREKELQLTWWPLITIGVWQIKLTRST